MPFPFKPVKPGDKLHPSAYRENMLTRMLRDHQQQRLIAPPSVRTSKAGGGATILFGVAQSVGGNEVTLKPCNSWDDPTLIPGAADVVCFIAWPIDTTVTVSDIELTKVYAYLPIPRGTGSTVNRGALLPLNFLTGC